MNNKIYDGYFLIEEVDDNFEVGYDEEYENWVAEQNAKAYKELNLIQRELK